MSLVRRDWPDFQELVQRLFDGETEKSWMRVEEFVDDKTLVVRAELPGMDPDKDVQIDVTNGELHIKAERQEKTEHKEKGSYRSEFKYGAFTRTFRLPTGATEADVKATYTDGVLEVRVPLGEEVEPAPVKVPITRG
jgi:HSP20 family protein